MEVAEVGAGGRMEPVVRGSADASPRDEAPTGRIPPTRPFADQRRVGTEQRMREARLPLKFLTWATRRRTVPWAERGGVGVGRDPHVGGVCGTPGVAASAPGSDDGVCSLVGWRFSERDHRSLLKPGEQPVPPWAEGWGTGGPGLGGEGVRGPVIYRQDRNTRNYVVTPRDIHGTVS